MENSNSKSRDESSHPERRGKNIIVVDTNVMMDDPSNAIENLYKDGNLVVIPFEVINELDGLKKSPSDRMDAQRAIISISLALEANKVKLEERTYFTGTKFIKNKPDHIIIATAHHALKELKRGSGDYGGYGVVKFISEDYGARLASKIIRDDRFLAETYKKGQTKIEEKELKTYSVNIPVGDNKPLSKVIPVPKKDKSRLTKNAPVIIYSDAKGKWEQTSVAYRQDDSLYLIDNNIKIFNQTANGNGHINWEQVAAIHFLQDKNIECVFLQGGAGTGKTFLALAAALHGKKEKVYDQIIVSRPTVPLANEDMGYLPGDMAAKFSPWLIPIVQNVAYITGSKIPESVNDFEGFLSLKGILIQPLSYVRGTTFNKSIIIIDEAQNLTRHQIKTIITRAGKGTKIIFTGDLHQIDTPRLSMESSGLTHAIKSLSGQDTVAVVNLGETVRSHLAELGATLL